MSVFVGAGSGFRIPRWYLALVFVVASETHACGDAKQVDAPGLSPLGVAKTAKADEASGQKPSTVSARTSSLSFTDDDFIESDSNRDPFRVYTTLFKIDSPRAPQRQVAMSNTAIEEMKLIAIVSGTPTPKAMLVDPSGVGHVVERGMYIGKPQVVRASENILLTLNWKVDRIRPNEVVLTREDPSEPNRPPLTRVIPMREEETAPR